MIVKDRYEISLWKDEQVVLDNKYKYFEEFKIATIGSNTMTAQYRALEPNLVNNINGTNTFTFKIYYLYIDNETGELVRNPFVEYLTNERKIKVLWKDKWYDLVIKNCQENSKDHTITYTCKDLFINELSKTGFDLEFDTELANNTGNVKNLTLKVLNGTDWLYKDSDTILQENEEAVFRGKVESSFVATDADGNNRTFSRGEEVFIYYSMYANKPNFFQFYWESTPSLPLNGEVLLTNGKCYSVEVQRVEGNSGLLSAYINGIIAVKGDVDNVVEGYRANRLVRSQEKKYDAAAKQIVSIYELNGYRYHGFLYSEFDQNGDCHVNYAYYPEDHTYINREEILKGSSTIISKDGPSANFIPVYLGFEKIRSITAKNSNRFNLIQSIAETFECWPEFIIEHYEEGNSENQTPGRIKRNSQGIALKYVRFVKEKGQRTGVNFSYGVDLQSITRTIDSEQVATKVIVTPNNNEFATDGFCTIARAEENIHGCNFVLNFDYYINQGLLNRQELERDLYISFIEQPGASGLPQTMGYYDWLKYWNTLYRGIADSLAKKQIELIKKNALETVYGSNTGSYSSYYSGSDIDLTDIEQQLISMVNGVVTEKISNMSGVDAFVSAYGGVGNTKIYISIDTLYDYYLKAKSGYNEYSSLNNNLNSETLEGQIAELKTKMELYVSRIEELHQAFYLKYSRFLQEGSWISEDYVDDNVYYLDALKVAHTSSRPKISYNISVLRLSGLEEYKNKSFQAGDICSIEDTKFFGYTIDAETGRKRPYREEVLVSELSSWFDSPDKDTFKIQNYKTQFEDLFQRITASTQALEYNEGSYNSTVNRFTPTGALTADTLMNSVAANENLVFSSQNDTVITDSTGLTVLDMIDKDKKVRVTSGGVFVSSKTADGETAWLNAITGSGVSTQALSAGSINVNNIVITNNNFRTFLWDNFGINAYSFEYDDNNKVTSTNTGTFVRFDQYGLYGMKDQLYSATDENGNPTVYKGFIPSSENGEQEIWDNAAFGLTWKGFFLKNKEGHGRIEVSTENDIAVITEKSIEDNIEDIVRIKIGRIGYINDTNEPLYGIRLCNSDGLPVMETSDEGDLWLKNIFKVGSGETNEPMVTIGYNPNVVKPGTTDIHEVIHAGIEGSNSYFAVYEDGYVTAKGVNIEGTINATGGKIGNLEIADLENLITPSESFSIKAKKGLFFKTMSDLSVSPADGLEFEIITEGLTLESIKWEISQDFITWTEIEGATDKNYTLEYNPDWFLNDTMFLKASSGNFSDYVTIMHIANGADGSSFLIDSNVDEIVKYKELIDGDKDKITYSPTSLSFQVKRANDESSTSIRNFSFSLEVGADTSEGYKWYSGVEGLTAVNEQEFLEYFLTEETTQPTPIAEDDESNLIPWDSVVFNFVDFINAVQNYDNASSTQKEVVEVLSQKECVIRITVFNSSQEVVSVKPISLRYATTEDMASFSLHASGITAAIRNSSLNFSENGLQIFNGGFIITNRDFNLTQDEEPLVGKTYYIEENGKYISVTIEESFDPDINYYEASDSNLMSYSPETKALEIVGSGSFTGRIEASSGSFRGAVYASEGEFTGTIHALDGDFTGSINANNGTIGGFKIGVNSIASEDGKLTLNSGENSSIKVENITLGTGAVIEDYINIGNVVWLMNPISNDGKVLVVDGYLPVVESELTNPDFSKQYYEKGSDGIYTPIRLTLPPYFQRKYSAFSIFAPTTDSSPLTGKDYYIINKLGEYEKIGEDVSIFEEGVTYYNLKTPDPETTYYIKRGLSYTKANVENGFDPSTEYYVESYPYYTKLVPFSLNDEGLMSIGDLRFDGMSSTVTGGNWSITNNEATFANATISGTIRAANFEYGKVQTVGGSMIFKPTSSFEIIDSSNTTANIKLPTGLELLVDDYLVFSSTEQTLDNVYGKVTNWNEKEKIATVSIDSSIDGYNTLILLGHCTFDKNVPHFTEDLVIGANATDNRALIPARGISIVQARAVSGNQLIFNTIPNVFIGDLTRLGNDINNTNIKGYGLYSENVYLTGSLTTQVGELGLASYAGVNTLSGVRAKVNIVDPVDPLFELVSNTAVFDENKEYYIRKTFGKEYIYELQEGLKEFEPGVKYYINIKESPKIVFWAGSTDTKPGSIQNAKFQVTESGILYAQAGRFEGSIITDAIIQGSSIYAANLYGGSAEETAALNIYDTEMGIQFKSRKTEETLLTLGTDGFYYGEKTNDNCFIELLNNSASYYGKYAELNSLRLQEDEWFYDFSNPSIALRKREQYNGYRLITEEERELGPQLNIVYFVMEDDDYFQVENLLKFDEFTDYYVSINEIERTFGEVIFNNNEFSVNLRDVTNLTGDVLQPGLTITSERTTIYSSNTIIKDILILGDETSTSMRFERNTDTDGGYDLYVS